MSLTAKDFEGKNLVQKLAMIQGEARYVQKGGYNAHHKYKYVKEADLVEKVAPLLSMAGIMLIPHVVHQERVGTLTRIVMGYTITDGSTSIEASVVGEGSDAQDKAAYKATTGAHKYMLYKLFNIETGDDPEQEEEPPPRVSSPRSAQSMTDPVVAMVTKALGGNELDDKEMVYVRMNECQTEAELVRLGQTVKTKYAKDARFMSEFGAEWKKRLAEINSGN